MTRTDERQDTSVALADAPAVAVFDLDGTLTRSDTFLPFLITFAIRQRRWRPLVVLPVVVGLYVVRLMADRTAKGHLVRAFCRGQATAEIEAHAEWFLENWARRRLRGEVVEALEQHRAAGLTTILLSASPDLYVPAIGRALGFDEVVCTRIAVVGDRCEGGIVGANCKGAEKVEAIRRLLGCREAPPGSLAYGDSPSDLPLLEWVDHGFLVTRTRARSCRPHAGDRPEGPEPGRCEVTSCDRLDLLDAGPSAMMPHNPSSPEMANEPGHSPALVAGVLAREPRDRSMWENLSAYVSIARPDHWFKNVFMLLGILLACFYHPGVVGWGMAVHIGWAFVATCLIASSNYVINEILDAPTDRRHPVKRHRPIPSGLIWLPAAYIEWVALGAVGLALAATISMPFLYSALLLLVMGLLYNIPPARTKEHPYVDVLSESINNPIRLLLGWFALVPSEFPPVSLLIAYWMIGAFFMASKRFAEYRSIGDAETAAAYRGSFRFYDETKLLISMFFYTTCFALFLGVFIIRYHLELILIFPLISGFVCYYLHIAFKPDSPAQNPERLYRERGLMIYLTVCVAAFFLLMFAQVPFLYEIFNVRSSSVPPLWQL